MKPKAIFFILFSSILIFCINITKPFYGYHDWNGITYGQIAKNFVRYSPLVTRLGQVENHTFVSPANFTFDTHYPPLFTLLLSLPVMLLGSKEWAIRLLPISLSLLNLYLIYRLASLIRSTRVGILAATIALLTPIFIYFGKNPVHEVLVLTFVLLNTLLYLKSVSFNGKYFIKPLLLVAFLSLFSGWGVYYQLPLMAFFGYLRTKNRLYLPLAIFPFVGFLIHLLHIRLLTGSFTGGGLLSIFLYRLNIRGSDSPDQYNLIGFINRFLLFSRNMFTLPLLFTSLVGVVINKKFFSVFLILSAAIIHPILFSNIGYIHDYLQLPILATLAISTALLFDKILPNKLLLPAGALISFAFLLTKLPFTIAMINSAMSKPEYELTQKYLSPLRLGESVILPGEIAIIYRGVVTPYYLQKEVNFTSEVAKNYLITNNGDTLSIQKYD